jgi:predicted nuclease of restriction endonuclease-like (RecB) superfamily
MVISELEDSGRMQPELGLATTMSSAAPTADAMLPEAPESYQRTLDALVERVQAARVRALRSVNQELVLLYWDIGREILERQEREGWGAKVIDRLARDLRSLFPDMGMSSRNLKYMRAFAKAWHDPEIVQGHLAQSPVDRKVPQAVAQIPWGHIRTLLDKLDDSDVRLWYATKAAEHGWSRSVLVHQIEGALHLREGKGLTNFDETLPSPQSEIAQQITRNPYIFGFLGLDEPATERALEHGLMAHVERFLLEMGEGFAVVGRQRHLEVGGQDFYIDLLLYQLVLRCYVVVELKVGEFKPEYSGKMNFYLAAVDEEIKRSTDQPTIGLVLCKGANETVVEYALRDINTPIQVSEYRTQPLPEPLRQELPATAEIEAVLRALPMPN